MTTEEIRYDSETEEGAYTIKSDKVTVTVPFSIKNRATYYNLKNAVCLARTKAFVYFNGEKTDKKFREYMDFISTWFEPCDDMLKSRGETAKNILENQWGFYPEAKNYNNSLITDIDVFCAKYFEKEAE